MIKPPLSFTLLMYDITHDRTLQKVARELEKHGYERINYSVWLGWRSLKEDSELRLILEKLLKKPEAAGSRLYSMPLKLHTLRMMRSITGRKPTGLDYWTGEMPLLFI
jgi:CRISPR-associated endonuclease Cas2